MDESKLKLTIFILMNFMDIVMAYYLCHCLIDKKMSFSFKKAGFWLGYGIVMGSLFYILDGYIFRVISTVLMICILKFISQKKNQEVFLIYILIFLCITFVQMPLLLFVQMFTLGQDYALLVTQILSLTAVILIGIRVPFYELLHLIERKVLLKLIVFLLIIITTIFLLFANFEYSVPYLLYFSLFILIAIINLCYTINRISFYTSDVPMRLHDVKNLLISLHTNTYGTTSIDEVRKGLDECMELMNLNIQMKQIQVNQDQENLLAFIQQKKEGFASEVTILTDLHYYDKNRNLSLTMILYMLGVLLDNALEHGGCKPILIDASLAEYYVLISVANAYAHKRPDFNKMLKKGYSTKEKDGRGYGLLNLSKAVEKYGGEIIFDYRYLPDYESYYIFIKIELTAMAQCKE